MKYKTFVKIYSHSRINRYYKAVNGNKQKAMLLYFANMKIAQAFHPLLGTFEVVLRNQLHYILANHFSDSNWIINQKTGFMSAASLTYINKKTQKKISNDYLLREIQKAEKRLSDKGVFITPGRIIAEQTLGFWNSFYEKHHYILLSGAPNRIFKDLPRNVGRKEINEAIKKVRELRNRINHNEPICFSDKKYDFTYTKDMYQLITEFLNWINTDILKSLQGIDRVMAIIEREERKFKDKQT